MHHFDWQRYTAHTLLALGVSGLLLALLARFSLAAADTSLLPRMVAILTAISATSLLLYLAAIGARTVFQALRYRLILGATEDSVPGFFHLLLVTASRNMFVDMLPARLGELSYVAMLNRGYRVGLPACLSSLVISFAFDLAALGLIIAAIVVHQLFSLGVEPWVIGTLLMVGLVFAFLLVLLFPGLRWATRLIETLASRLPGVAGRLTARLGAFGAKLAGVLEETRAAGILGRLLALSLGVRVAKYLGFYTLFAGVAAVAFPQLDTHPVHALIALISAEAGASMPLPSFMGFGSYEAAGMLAMMALGADRAASLLIMLSLHVLSQIIDYALGGVALITFAILTRSAAERVPAARPGRFSWYGVSALVLFLAGVALFVLEARSLQKLGALRPPDRGHALAPAGDTVPEGLAGVHGFVVWSSNRSGNHDLWLLSLPDGAPRQLTTHPHTEYYPRVSPDGRRVVFARSQQPWVSQRNKLPWDVVLLDLDTGRERLLAKNGNVPTWSADGARVYFLRNGNQLVELEVASGKEAVVWESGRNLGVRANVLLETPAVAPRGGAVAVTFRGGRRATAVIDADGTIRRVGDGCQLGWAPDGSYLFHVDHGGRQQNAIYRTDPATLKPELWFDAPGEFSHEYFPRVANTGDWLVYGASTGGHEHDTADYEIFLWPIGRPAAEAIRLTHHTGNDCWPDIFLNKPNH